MGGDHQRKCRATYIGGTLTVMKTTYAARGQRRSSAPSFRKWRHADLHEFVKARLAPSMSGTAARSSAMGLYFDSNFQFGNTKLTLTHPPRYQILQPFYPEWNGTASVELATLSMSNSTRLTAASGTRPRTRFSSSSPEPHVDLRHREQPLLWLTRIDDGVLSLTKVEQPALPADAPRTSC
jgi:hypothetical protein